MRDPPAALEMADRSILAILRSRAVWRSVSAQGHMARQTPARNRNVMPGLTRMTPSAPIISGGHASGLPRLRRASLALSRFAAMRLGSSAANRRAASMT